MATQTTMKREDDLPDLEETLEEEQANNDMEMEYQTEPGDVADNPELMNTLIIDQSVIEGMNQGESYIPEELESPAEQQFLTLSQGNSQVTVNDNGSIVYTDHTFMDSINEHFVEKSEDQEDNSEVTTMYYQTDDIDAQYLTEEGQLQDEGDAQGHLEASDDNTLVLSANDSQLVDDSVIEHVQVAGSLGNVTVLNKSDLKKFLRVNQEPRSLKRLAPGPSKSIVAKVFVQNASTPKNVLGNIGKRKISFAEAQKAGIIPPKLQQIFSTPGAPTRVVVKKVPSSSGSSVLVKSPTKILPAPGPKDRIMVSGLRGHPIRTSIPMSQLKTFLTTTTAQGKPIVNKTVGGMTVVKTDGRPTQKVYVRPGNVGGQLRIPFQIAGKQQVQYVKVMNPSSNSNVTYTTVKPKYVHALGRPPTTIQKSSDGLSGKRIVICEQPSLQLKKSSGVPVTFKGKSYTAVKSSTQIKSELSNNTESPMILIEREETKDDSEQHLEEDKEYEELEDVRGSGEAPESPQKLLEANGIRPKKPCNCTRSQCLKLYCECFANGEFCFQCNCNNCFNNIDHEEERQMSIQSCLERNPLAFRSKIHVLDSDEEERRDQRGCNCKRSHCLKNYCECFEAKINCGKSCKCVSCRNTEEEMAAWSRGELADSEDEKDTTKEMPFMPQPLSDALCRCILEQAVEAEERGDDEVTTEQLIIEELGQRLVQIIGNRIKRDSR